MVVLILSSIFSQSPLPVTLWCIFWEQLSHCSSSHSLMMAWMSLVLMLPISDLILQVCEMISSSSQSSSLWWLLRSVSSLIFLTSWVWLCSLGSHSQRLSSLSTFKRWMWKSRSHSYLPVEQYYRIFSLNYIPPQINIIHILIIIMSMLSPRFELDKKRTRTRTMFALPPEKWYDVQDEDGVWRVGYCEKTEQQYKVISLDGFHPSHSAYYCEHAAKIAPVRTHTRGLTVPQAGKTLRRIITLKQVQSIMGKLNLYQLKSNQFENTCEGIRGFLRTELFITVDKIFNTPFEILGTIKLIDIHINKFFINVIEFYLKLLESSKKFLIVLDSNQIAVQLYNATYEMTLLIEMILGVHKRSKVFYQSSLNRTVTPEGFLDCFIKSEAGIIPFKLFFKSASGLKLLGDNDMAICMEVICLFVSMCEKYQKEFVEGSKYQATTRIIVEEIINLVKSFCEKSQSLRAKCKERMEIISRIETLYLKLFPNKPCIIRKIIDGDIEQEKQSLKDKFLVELQAEKKSKLQEKDNEKMKELQAKINTLQTTISKLQTISIHNQNISVVNEKEQMGIPNQPTENLGEQAFLGSLEWALDSGDINTCKKLIVWRRSLLKLGRITGWEIALAVGMKTFKKKEITPDDIIEANYNFLLREAASSK